MKSLILFFLLTLSIAVIAQQQQASGIKIITRMKVEEGNYDKSNITIMKDHVKYKSFKGDQKIDLLLFKDSHYEFIYTKAGYIKKRIIISTKQISEERWKKGFLTFPFDVTIEPQPEDEEPIEYDNPVAYIEYDLVFDDFYTATDYTTIEENLEKESQILAETPSTKGIIKDIILRPINVIDNEGFMNKYEGLLAETPKGNTNMDAVEYQVVFSQLAEAMQKVQKAKEIETIDQYKEQLELLYATVDKVQPELKIIQKKMVVDKLIDNLDYIGSNQDEYVVMSVFTSALYGSNNQKTFGYINYGDGAGYKELSEVEYEQYRCKYYGCRMEKHF